MTLILNPRVRRPGQPLADGAAALDRPAADRALDFLRACPAYRPTPLWSLSALAADLGLGAIRFKDESFRLGLNSFKALGGVYAVAEILAARASALTGRAVEPAALTEPAMKRLAGDVTFVCASDGNHGRAVAAGARLFGARCVVYLHEGVTEARRAAIADLGAEVRRVAGTYDHSVDMAERVAAEQGWTLAPDTSDAPDAEIPAIIMRGYSVLIQEALVQAPRPPTHVFVQAGVGGLAAAVAAYCANVLGEERPRIVVVEPDRANCLLVSCRTGRPTALAEARTTVFAMLECLKPSRPAWDILDAHADAFMDVPDEAAAGAMLRLVEPLGSDPAVVSGESGCAGFAALRIAAGDPGLRADLALSERSEVLLVGTEGATDPAVFEALTGRSPRA